MSYIDELSKSFSDSCKAIAKVCKQCMDEETAKSGKVWNEDEKKLLVAIALWMALDRYAK